MLPSLLTTTAAFLPVQLAQIGDILDFTSKVSEEGAGFAPSAGEPIPVITGIINIFLTLIGVIFLVLILYGGFRWMTAGGETENIKKAQGTIRNAVIGLVIVLLAWAITLFVVDKIGGATVG